MSVSGSEAEVEEEALEVEGQQLPAEGAAAPGGEGGAPQRQGNGSKRKQEATAGSLSSLKRDLAEAQAAKRAKTEATQQAAEAQQAGETQCRAVQPSFHLASEDVHPTRWFPLAPRICWLTLSHPALAIVHWHQGAWGAVF